MKRTILVAIADDYLPSRDVLVSYLNQDHHIEVLFVAKTGIELLKFLESRIPDVILLDIEMPEMGGEEALIRVKAKYPEIKIIMQSNYIDRELKKEFLRRGAKAVLSKNVSLSEISNAILRVYFFGEYIEPVLKKELEEEIANTIATNSSLIPKQLDELQMKIFKLMQQGKDTSQIAKNMKLNKRTVEFHYFLINAILDSQK